MRDQPERKRMEGTQEELWFKALKFKTPKETKETFNTHLSVCMLSFLPLKDNSQLSKSPEICCQDEKAGESKCITGLHPVSLLYALPEDESG